MVFYQAVELLGGRCRDCGYCENLNALEFDHVPERGPKLYSIAVWCWSYCWETLVKELRKCDLVCSNCHSIRMAGRRVYTELTAIQNGPA